MFDFTSFMIDCVQLQTENMCKTYLVENRINNCLFFEIFFMKQQDL